MLTTHGDWFIITKSSHHPGVNQMDITTELAQIIEQEKALAAKKEQLMAEGKNKLIASIVEQMGQFKVSMSDLADYKRKKDMEGKTIIFEVQFKDEKGADRTFQYFNGKKGAVPNAIIKMGKSKLLGLCQNDDAKAWVNGLVFKK